jgi:hypothetical protein
MADTSRAQLAIQRIEVDSKVINFKYDYKLGGRDVLGIIMPKIISDSTGGWGGMIVKTGDGGKSDQFTVDTWGYKKFGQFSTFVEIGRITSQISQPIDYAGTRLACGNFTAEFYALTYHAFLDEKFTAHDATYGWIAYHPQHAFIALGKQDRQYWGLVGTRNLPHFGTFNFVNYQPETGNFWFRSQNGFGEINQKFFAQDNYIEGTSYLVVPVFFYKHFSPICAKGTYSLRIDGRRTNGVQNYEIMMGKKIGNDIVRLAVGANTEYITTLRIAPSLELYKTWKTKDIQNTIELRYDVLYKALSLYLVLKY